MIVYLCAHQNRFVAFGKMVALSSLLEYVLSALSENLFHELLWDYSNLPFSIGTRVNLIFSLAWGVLGLFVLTVVEPRMRRAFARHSAAIRRFSVGMSALIAADLCISALSRVI